MYKFTYSSRKKNPKNEAPATRLQVLCPEQKNIPLAQNNQLLTSESSLLRTGPRSLRGSRADRKNAPTYVCVHVRVHFHYFSGLARGGRWTHQRHTEPPKTSWRNPPRIPPPIASSAEYLLNSITSSPGCRAGEQVPCQRS